MFHVTQFMFSPEGYLYFSRVAPTPGTEVYYRGLLMHPTRRAYQVDETRTRSVVAYSQGMPLTDFNGQFYALAINRTTVPGPGSYFDNGFQFDEVGYLHCRLQAAPAYYNQGIPMIDGRVCIDWAPTRSPFDLDQLNSFLQSQGWASVVVEGARRNYFFRAGRSTNPANTSGIAVDYSSSAQDQDFTPNPELMSEEYLKGCNFSDLSPNLQIDVQAGVQQQGFCGG